MNAWMLRMSTMVLTVVLLLGTAGCVRLNDDKKNDGDDLNTDEQEGDIPTLDQFDPNETYELPDYFSLDIDEYITLGQYRGLTLTLAEEDFSVAPEAVEAEITKILQEHHPDARVVNRPVAWGDTVVVSYVGKRDGVAFSGGTAYDQTIAVEEENGYIPGFVEGLVGVLPGEPTDVPMTFPEDYHNTDLAGADVVFTFTVSYIEGTPELTDDFVTAYTQGAYTNAEVFRASIEKQLQDTAYEHAVHNALWAEIAENATVIQYPEQAVMHYYSSMYQAYLYYASYFGMDYETYLAYGGLVPQDLFDVCMQTVKQEMVYYAVIRAGDYTYTDEQYEQMLDEYTDQNYEALYELMISSGAQDFTRAQARQYLHENYHSDLVFNCLEKNASDDLLADTVIHVQNESSDAGESLS